MNKTVNKKVFLTGIIALTICGVTSMTAQVGINTETPKTTLDIVSDTAVASGGQHGQGFRLIDDNQNSGRVLTSNTDGVGTWEDPPFAYTPVPPTNYTDSLIWPNNNLEFSQIHSLKDSVGNPYYIAFPDYGTYFVSLEFKQTVNLNPDSIKAINGIVQIRPTPYVTRANDWAGVTPNLRFTGEYEVYAVKANTISSLTTIDLRYIVNQMIQVTPQTGLKGYLTLQLLVLSNSGSQYLKQGSAIVSTYILNFGANPQTSGGAFVKVSNVVGS